MGSFRSIVFSSVIAGLAVGLIVTLLQQFGTVPLILKAEVFEKAAEVHQAAICAVHRGAFRTLLGTKPTPQACLAYFAEFEGAFRAAASLKIARKCIPAGTNLHLTSRDIARILLESNQIERGEQP